MRQNQLLMMLKSLPAAEVFVKCGYNQYVLSHVRLVHDSELGVRIVLDVGPVNNLTPEPVKEDNTSSNDEGPKCA